jgi:hypothetical protein
VFRGNQKLGCEAVQKLISDLCHYHLMIFNKQMGNYFDAKMALACTIRA